MGLQQVSSALGEASSLATESFLLNCNLLPSSWVQRPQLLWGKNEDGSNHIRWKSLNCSAPRKVRTVTGGREEAIEIRQGGHRSSRSAPRASPTASSHRFTAITTVDGHVVRVRTASSYDGCYTKDVPAHLVHVDGDAWLVALRQMSC